MQQLLLVQLLIFFSLQISFDDFQALFESERDSIKRQRIESGGNEEYQLVLESSPLAIVPSPSPLDESTKNADVVLRHKRPRLQREEQSHSSGLELSLAHIGRGPGDEISPVEHGQCSNQVFPVTSELISELINLTNIEKCRDGTKKEGMNHGLWTDASMPTPSHNPHIVAWVPLFQLHLDSITVVVTQ